MRPSSKDLVWVVQIVLLAGSAHVSAGEPGVQQDCATGGTLRRLVSESDRIVCGQVLGVTDVAPRGVLLEVGAAYGVDVGGGCREESSLDGSRMRISVWPGTVDPDVVGKKVVAFVKRDAKSNDWRVVSTSRLVRVSPLEGESQEEIRDRIIEYSCRARDYCDDAALRSDAGMQAFAEHLVAGVEMPWVRRWVLSDLYQQVVLREPSMMTVLRNEPSLISRLLEVLCGCDRVERGVALLSRLLNRCLADDWEAGARLDRFLVLRRRLDECTMGLLDRVDDDTAPLRVQSVVEDLAERFETRDLVEVSERLDDLARKAGGVWMIVSEAEKAQAREEYFELLKDFEGMAREALAVVWNEETEEG